MAQNRKIRMGLAHSTSKTKERDLLKLSKRIAKDPLIVLPTCSSECEKDPFTKVRKQLERVRDAADDEELLKKLSKKGDPLARAVAGTILLKHAGKIPMLAVFRAAWGEASYAIRGKCSKEKLVGVQNIDHPLWRMFAVLDIVKKRKVFLYSDKKGMICTGRKPHPPKQFVEWDIKQLPFHLTRNGDIHHCKHLKPEEVREGKIEGRAYLKILWRSADRTLVLDESCAKDENTVGLLSRYIAGPKVTDYFDISVHYRPVCGIEDCSSCVEDWNLNTGDIKNYRKSQMSDLDIIQRGRKTFEGLMTAEGKRVYIASGVCYGSDVKAFIDSLNPDSVERTALETVLEDHDASLITDSATPSKILSLLWDDHGQSALEAVTGDPKLARELQKKHDASNTTISDLLREAEKMIRIHAVLSSLPDYPSLPADWEFADGVGRSYRTGGKNEAIEYIQKQKDASMPLAWAFFLALDSASGKEWMFNEIQREHGSGVNEQARQLLEANSSSYHEALSSLMRALGSSKEISPL